MLELSLTDAAILILAIIFISSIHNILLFLCSTSSFKKGMDILNDDIDTMLDFLNKIPV